MEWLKNYASAIIFITFLSIILKQLVPNGTNKKYINLVISFLVTLVLVSPLKKLPSFKDNILTVPNHSFYNEAYAESTDEMIVREFEKKLELTINEEIYKNKGRIIKSTVYAALETDGIVIKKIEINPYDNIIAEYVKNLTKADSVTEGKFNE